MSTRSYILILLSLLLISCVEVFRPELDDYDSYIVVDGGITNLDGPYTVELSYSSPLDNITPKPISGAKITIMEEDGMIENLTEISEGKYMTHENGIQGAVGKRYKILIENEGEKYESEYELLREPTGISSVDAQLEYRSFPDAPEIVPGFQFYVNSSLSEQKDNYFIWSLEGTYKYEASLLIYYEFNGFVSRFYNHDSLKTCYLTYNLNEIYTANTDFLEVPRISAKPLTFIPADDRKLKIRYSLLTNQYSVSKEAYEFWHELETQSTNNTSLFTHQPYQIRGNVVNINDPEEPVLGYFLVAGVSQNRIFVDKPEGVDIFLDECALDYRGYAWIFWTSSSEWPIYITVGEGGRAVAADGCMDCREIGGVLEKPSFWVE